ncbi:transglycosylase SLT domain-containing protein [Chitinibacter sp. S2-10]|uniref:transglycosylase SLT domain-containing protein n=1 Tax=Chitinibacter sp. S2-10 TaxID=3373597 RepID=UPI003977451F
MPVQASQYTGDFPVLSQKRLIRVLVVPSKTNYFVDRGVLRGVVYESMMALEQDINRQRGKKALALHVVFIATSRDQLLPALIAGKGDIAAANLTITNERKTQVDFTAPVNSGVAELLISGPASPKVGQLNDLSGKTVFIRKSSSYWQSVLTLNQQLKAAGKAPVVLKAAPETLEDEDLLEMLNSGLVQFVIVDSHKAAFWKQIFPKITVHQQIALRQGGEIAWAIRKNSPQLKQQLDQFIVTHKAGTSFGNTLLRRYLRELDYVKDATSVAERQKFAQMVNFFRKYSAQYRMDFLLMAAQGYQESRLNQQARSHVGAIGVMQVMPATGKELNVGDIRQLEPNIHAGIKYIRQMVDQHFAKEPMSEVDKHLFAFASYNAGAAKIKRLRAEAQQRGLNPNVWFNQVEVVVADKIGRETVQYVSNIYKYYIAYTLLMENQLAAKKNSKAG